MEEILPTSPPNLRENRGILLSFNGSIGGIMRLISHSGVQKGREREGGREGENVNLYEFSLVRFWRGKGGRREGGFLFPALEGMGLFLGSEDTQKRKEIRDTQIFAYDLHYSARLGRSFFFLFFLFFFFFFSLGQLIIFLYRLAHSYSLTCSQSFFLSFFLPPFLSPSLSSKVPLFAIVANSLYTEPEEQLQKKKKEKKKNSHPELCTAPRL